jgi:energy-coupling factor transporter ATP-binding protein EcfA2
VPSERLEMIRQLGAKYWKPAISATATVVAALKIIGDLEKGSPTHSTWVAIGVGVTILVIIRFPRVAFAITRVILGPPKLPSNPRPIFRGPRPFTAADAGKLPGRDRDIDECWSKIREHSFFVIDGGSGCGKSSLLNAGLLPLARGEFTVVESRVSDDPFGKLRGKLLGTPYIKEREGVSHDELRRAIRQAAQAGSNSADTRRTNGLLLCLDQFEDLFTTVENEVRVRFLEVLKHAIELGQIRLVIGIRDDFFDLLMKLIQKVDPKHEVLDLGNSETVWPFSKRKAEAVLRELLKPIYDEQDPLLGRELDDFCDALVEELLRAPGDKRLYPGDQRSVLPVELQTVGMMIENFGDNNFSAKGVRDLGGKLGLLRQYLEDAKTYVWKRTGAPPEAALLILRKLISSAQPRRLPQAPGSIAMSLGVSAVTVKEVLDAFSTKYLVHQVVDECGEIKYELMHDHLAQILVEAPDPILQRAKDASERLAFWSRRTAVGAPAAIGDKGNRLLALLAQPIPIVESLRLWRFADSRGERPMLARSMRGFGMRVGVAVLFGTSLWAGWTLWTGTDANQIRTILADAPVDRSYYGGDEDGVRQWARALECLGRDKEATGLMTYDPQALAIAVAEARVRSGKVEAGLELAKGTGSDLYGVMLELAGAGEVGKALAFVDTDRLSALIEFAEGLMLIGDYDSALEPLDRAMEMIKGAGPKLNAGQGVHVQGSGDYQVLRFRVGERGLEFLWSPRGGSVPTPAAREQAEVFRATLELYSAGLRLVSVGKLEKAREIADNLGDITRNVSYEQYLEYLSYEDNEELRSNPGQGDRPRTFEGLCEERYRAVFGDTHRSQDYRRYWRNDLLGRIEELDPARLYRFGLEPSLLVAISRRQGNNPGPDVAETQFSRATQSPAQASQAVYPTLVFSLIVQARAGRIGDAKRTGIQLRDRPQGDGIEGLHAAIRELYAEGRDDGALAIWALIDQDPDMKAVSLVREGSSRDSLSWAQGQADGDAALRTVSWELAREGKETEAIKAATLVKQGFARYDVLTGLADEFIKDGHVDAAKRAAMSFKNDDPDSPSDYERSQVLSHIAALLLQKSSIDAPGSELYDAVRVADQITDYGMKCEALARIAISKFRYGEDEQAANLLERAYRLALGVKNTNTQSQDLALVASGFAKLGYYAKARKAASYRPSSEDRLRSYGQIVIEYATAHNSEMLRRAQLQDRAAARRQKAEFDWEQSFPAPW